MDAQMIAQMWEYAGELFTWGWQIGGNDGAIDEGGGNGGEGDLILAAPEFEDPVICPLDR
ncbi:17815_t:CDS:2 [Racocetra fulgida]|uniref:17815_t:CDS:1 n=1 Tax=Racocetra fulgida TaxID=60492 RepID=A0A9N8VM28_9GLOM|nr:17815_t:CDS:2 [Racocetra fulgida]